MKGPFKVSLIENDHFGHHERLGGVGYYRKNHVFIFLIFHKVGGDLLLVEARKNLTLKMESIGVF